MGGWICFLQPQNFRDLVLTGMDRHHACDQPTAVAGHATTEFSKVREPDEFRLRTRAEAAAFLNVSETTIDRLRYQHSLAHYRIGGAVRFGQWDLLEFVSGKLVFPESLIENGQQVLTKADLGRFLGLSQRTVEHLIRNKGFWHRKAGRLVRFLLADVLTQLANDFRVPARSQL